MAVNTFRLPDPGEGLVEAEIVSWRVAVGDEVKINDILLEVETSKSVVELPTPFAGTVTALLVNEGDTVEVGTPIVSIDDGVAASAAGDDGVAASAAGDDGSAGQGGGFDEVAAEPTSAGEARVPNLVGYGPRNTETKRRPRKSVGADRGGTQVHDQLADSFSTGAAVSRRADHRQSLAHSVEKTRPSETVAPLPAPGPASREPVLSGVAPLAKPPVRKRAKDLGVDLAQVSGSGERGVITRDDVERAAGIGVEPPLADVVMPPPEPHVAETAAEPGRPETRIPIKGVHKAMAEAMVQSAFTAPHVSVSTTCDVSATMELVERLRQRREFRDLKVSPLLIVAKAVCLALKRTPAMNSAWDEPAGEVVLKHGVNLGIAAATPRGLVVPNVKGADSFSLDKLAQAINSIVATAREGRIQPADMDGGTFTITNIGVFGVDAGTPILNPGESGILCIGQIARRPWVVGVGEEERIEPRWVATLTVSFDHRLADGEQGSTFLADVAGILTDPGLALLY
ncbi:MAG TPA: dihydrolipoamide acetyltransferase family protein [Propionibacteriaceae bacterium]|nr:dihydrolipoamide acetyltransferase family protein [Propionibacteriaceae bacterium]